MLLDHAWIERHIPHQGRMCLLDEVLQWDATSVRCRSSSHRSPANPLRAHDRLGVACGIEYAAQAMAVHGALLAPQRVAIPAGYLGGLRDVTFGVVRLDEVDTDLIASAQRISAEPRAAIYKFELHGGGHLLLSGRAAVLFARSAP